VKGSLQFSETSLRVPEINAQLFGGQVRISGGLQDGKVLSWIRQAWGHRAGPVSEADLHALE
ncbi:MAG: hypothetical protein J0L57_04515, partial [Burkholderiales bacterium]|nr:hypothetical protein [Burkholderiales bacterium]